jgi:hypothetical protein
LLRNSGSLNRQRRKSTTRSRGRRVALAECEGLYHPRGRGEPAWIEIFIDNVFDGPPRLLMWSAYFRESMLAQALFHEIGRHIQVTRALERRGTEDVVEKWRTRFWHDYSRTRFWYLIPVLVPVTKVLKLVVLPFAAEPGVSGRR